MATSTPKHEKLVALENMKMGTLVKLTNGDIAEFVRLKQKKFIGIINGGSFDIPVNMYVETVGMSENVKQKELRKNEYKTLKPNEPFFIEQNGKAILFTFVQMENGRIIGVNPITRGKHRIDVDLYAGKVADI